MRDSDPRYRSAPAQLAAVAVIVILFFAARLPSAPADEIAELARRFSFTRQPLPMADQPPRFTMLEANPTIAHLRTYISTLTSSVALGDLDEDGLANDVCHAEMRTKEVILSPAPGTGDRYRPFALPAPSTVDLLTSYPSKCLIGDFNEDGLADLLVTYAASWPVAYLRRTADDGSYARPGAADFAVRLLAQDGSGEWMPIAAVTADMDGDGHADLVVGNYFPDGSPLFNPARPLPVDMNDTFSAARNGGTNRILLWEGASSGREPAVRFREIANPFPDDDANGWTLALGVADLDHDGLVDLYVANDFGPDTLYANRSTPGHVRLVRLIGRRSLTMPKSRVLGYDSFKSMGVDFADINGDGYFDMFVSNIAAPWAVQESHFLWTSTGDISRMDEGFAPYVDRGEELGVAHSSWGWDSRFADFDNDGVQEAIQATGFIKGRIDRWPNLAELAVTNDRLARNPDVWPTISPTADVNGSDNNPFYVRGRSGRFVDVSAALGLGDPWNTRGIAISDADGDGDLDFIYGNAWEDSQFYRNDSRQGGYVALHVLRAPAGVRGQRTTITSGHPMRPADGWPAFGALARLRLPDGTTRVGQVDGGSGHTGLRSPEIHFGLGSLPPESALTLELMWRDELGKVRKDTFAVTPGWHTIRLASGAQ